MKVRFQALQGYAYGAIQPSVVLRFPRDFDAKGGDFRFLASIVKSLGVHCGTVQFEKLGRLNDIPSTPSKYARLIAGLNAIFGDKAFTPIKVFFEGNELAFALPTLSTDLVWHNMAFVSKLMRESPRASAQLDVDSLVDNLKTAHRHYLPGGTNALPFIMAAAERCLPFKVLMRDYIIFGYGAGSRIFRSSITETEKSIGVGLASNKVDTNRLLRLSGLPVADQARVANVQSAKHFAKIFGYPVVLKPDNASRGRGVYTNITDEAELKACFSELEKTFSVILLEKHMPGVYHRINVVGGELVLAVRRTLPYVTGNGILTIKALIDEMNAEPERNEPNSRMRKVVIDDDLHRCLRKQGYCLEDVLETGHSLYLKSIAKMSQGASQTDIEADMHPENLELCRKVARIMRLEVLGIDILSPDLTVPWYKTETSICEVNAQPQLDISSRHAYPMILEKYIPQQPRVEVRITTDESNQQELLDTTANVVRLKLTAENVLSEGCPVQYYDTLSIADDVSAQDRSKLSAMLVSVQPIKN